jgi:hypothetical protein
MIGMMPSACFVLSATVVLSEPPPPQADRTAQAVKRPMRDDVRATVGEDFIGLGAQVR